MTVLLAVADAVWLVAAFMASNVGWWMGRAMIVAGLSVAVADAGDGCAVETASLTG